MTETRMMSFLLIPVTTSNRTSTDTGHDPNLLLSKLPFFFFALKLQSNRICLCFYSTFRESVISFIQFKQ